jgi:hypothetical protein
MYFKQFPKFLYDFNADGTNFTNIVRDITKNVRFRKEVLENVTLYDEYDIVDGETPEIIAEKIYGNPEYHWIIMLANQRYDWLNDFPVEETTLVRCIECTFNPDFTITSWSYSGTTITATLENHGLQVSPTTQVKFTGATATTNAPNGTWYNITSVTADTFTFTANDIPTGDAGGTVTVSTQGKEKYIAHYLDEDGFKVDSDHPGAVGVTCEQMARDENEAKRRIKLISREAIDTIVKNFRDLI